MDSEWKEWRNHILKELQRLDHEMKIIHKDNRQILIEIATLKTHAQIWGAGAGVVAAGIMALLFK